MQASLIFLTFFLVIINNNPSQSFPDLSRQSQTNNNNNITLFGDAFFISDDNNSVSLTQEPSSCRFSSSSAQTTTEFFPFYGTGAGRAVYARPVRFLDPTTNATASFSTTFSFSIVPSPLCSAGDGMAFLIAPDAVPDPAAASAKGRMGLPGPPLGPRDSFFAVEFDTSFDPLLGDASANHVGVDLDSAVSVAATELVPHGIDLRAGREITAWVEYRAPPEGLVRVWLGYSPGARPRSPVLVAEVDLSDAFDEFMYVGFSGSNGHGSSLHVINMWKFKTFQRHSSLVLPMDDFEEGDCFICSDSSSSSSQTSNNSSAFVNEKSRSKTRLVRSGHARVLGDMILGIGGLVALVFSILAVAGVAWFLAMKRKLARRTRLCRQSNNGLPSRLSLAEIWAATMGFDQGRIVGVGASATVYKGSLQPGEAVAVKRFRMSSGGGGNGVACSSRNGPFNNEFETMVGCLRHKNLIQLRGWCCEGSELLLVYEYMPNGSLDKVLHGPAGSAVALSWKQRLNIVLGMASALAYLHEDCEKQIIHRDVKACNVMLDADFNAKLGDFGLAEVSGGVSRKAAPAGTVGYLAPEYVCSGVATAKTDVYSFGVVVLEVGTGRRAVVDGGDGDGDWNGPSVVDWAWGLWERGRLAEAVDLRLRGRAGEREVERMLVVGLACVHPNHLKRPTAREAARILRREVPLPALPARKPRLRPLRGLLPDEFEEAPSLDDDPFLTPRSEFI